MIARWQRYLRRHPRAADAAVTVVLISLSFPGSRVSVHGVSVPSQWPGWLLTGIACTALLLGHRSRPRAAAAAVIACTIAVTALGYVLTPLLLAPVMVALYTLALRTSSRTGYIVAFGTVAAVTCTLLIAGPHGEPFDLKFLGPVAWLLLPVPVGIAARLRLAYVEAAQARAEYAERTREEEARHRVAEERIRIARELHDVIAHHLAIANAQAGAVAHLLPADPGKAQQLAAGLTATTSSALREMKATVGLLRQADDLETPLEPAPGLAQLPELISSFCSAGLPVTLTTRGEPETLPPTADLTAFRIIQEALTNAARHAPGSQARVRIGYHAGRLDLAVTNDHPAAPPPPASTPGYGLIGMRERALSVGGRLQAGRRPEGGFQVAAELPLRPPGISGKDQRP